MIVIISATVLPSWYTKTIDGITHIEFITSEPTFNFILFRTICSFFMTPGENSLINLTVNIFLLFPFGLLLPIIWSKSGKRTIAYGMLFSIAIEILQIIPGRSTDIDDFILNVIGCVAGYGVCYLLKVHCFLVCK